MTQKTTRLRTIFFSMLPFFFYYCQLNKVDENVHMRGGLEGGGA